MGLIYAPSCSIKGKHQQSFSEDEQKKHSISCVTVIADIWNKHLGIILFKKRKKETLFSIWLPPHPGD